MGIHYDYKSTRGAKKMQKQQERKQRRLSMVELKEDRSPKELERQYQENLNLCCESDEGLSILMRDNADASRVMRANEGVQRHQDLMCYADDTFDRFKGRSIYCARALVFVLEHYPYF